MPVLRRRIGGGSAGPGPSRRWPGQGNRGKGRRLGEQGRVIKGCKPGPDESVACDIDQGARGVCHELLSRVHVLSAVRVPVELWRVNVHQVIATSTGNVYSLCGIGGEDRCTAKRATWFRLRGRWGCVG